MNKKPEYCNCTDTCNYTCTQKVLCKSYFVQSQKGKTDKELAIPFPPIRTPTDGA